jgi:hypothetical protein
MPRKAKNVIGTVVEQLGGYTFKVIAETERGWSRDRNNGIENPKQTIRKFNIECQSCGDVKVADYSSIFGKNNCICIKCKQANKPKIEKPKTERAAKPKLDRFNEETWEPKLKKDGTIDTRYINKAKKEFVGETFECVYDTFLVLEELPRVISKNGRYVYRNFRVECIKCKTQRETLAASLNAKGVACNKCRTENRNVKLDLTLGPIDIERKCEIMSEINQIWDEMKRMQRQGKLTAYLVDKFEVNDWLLDQENETEHIERTGYMDDGDDIDYDNPNIDWNNEIDKYL